MHADFDLGGIKIIEQLLALGRAHGPGVSVPHRMGSSEYEAAVGRSSVPLPAGGWPNPSWSQALGAAMRRHGVAVFEEHVVEDLLRH